MEEEEEKGQEEDQEKEKAENIGRKEDKVQLNIIRYNTHFVGKFEILKVII